MQFVGKTVQKPNSRFNWHRAGLKYSEQHCHCCILTDYLNKGVCQNVSYPVQILGKIEGGGRTETGAMNASKTSFRKSRETVWVLQLRNVFPMV